LTATSVKGHCPKCGPDRNADIVAKYDENIDDFDESVTVGHRVLSCRGCDSVYHQKITTNHAEYVRVEDAAGNDEWVAVESFQYWPAPAARPRPNWIMSVPTADILMYEILIELYGSLDQDGRILPSIGVRTAFDRGSELLGIDPAITFDEKLSELERLGHIGKAERIALDIMTDAGSAAAHRGWTPSLQQLNSMLNVLESFVHRCFVLPEDVSRLTGAFPAKPKRRPKGT
jgi:hypothetical protein